MEYTSFGDTSIAADASLGGEGRLAECTLNSNISANENEGAVGLKQTKVKYERNV